MSLLPPYPITIVENEDLLPISFSYYPVANGPVFSLSGYTAQMMVRLAIGDAAPLATYALTVDGTAGTVTFQLTATQATALAVLLAYGSGVYDILLTSFFGVKVHMVPASPISVQRSVTR